MVSIDMDQPVWHRWLANAERTPALEAVTVWKAGEEPFRWRWGELVDAAIRVGGYLTEAGVAPGDVCAVILRHDPHFYPLYLGLESIGAIPAVLAYPNSRLHGDKFREGLSGMATHSGLDWVLTEKALHPALAALVRGGTSTVRGILFPLEWHTEGSGPPSGQGLRGAQRSLRSAESDAPCLLQHSSGTTGLQKAVMLSHRAVLSHVQSYSEAIALSPDDKIVSWLPLYHDMGLIAAFHLPLALAIPTVHIDPFEWVAAPGLFLDVLSKEQGTISWLPNFAFALMAKRAREEDLEGITLDHVRKLINCSEPVRADSQDLFFERFARQGLPRSAMSACYAMAETTFAVAQTPPSEEPRRYAADRDKLARGQATVAQAGEPTRTCVSSGVPIRGCTVRAVDESGVVLGEGQVGELEIRSQYLFDGYRNQPERTHAVLRDGWFRSGDLGFLHEGDCYVVGRKKDLIIVAGKNLVPEDVEDAVNITPGVIPGRVVAFGIEDADAGTEIVAIVVETEVAGDAERKRLKTSIIQQAMRVDVTVSRVYLAPPRWMIKSSAGKLSRAANKGRALAELSPT